MDGFGETDMAEQLRVDGARWADEAAGVREYFEKDLYGAWRDAVLTGVPFGVVVVVVMPVMDMRSLVAWLLGYLVAAAAFCWCRLWGCRIRYGEAWLGSWAGHGGWLLASRSM